MNFILPDNIKKILSVLENAGYEAFFVGGCVRDMLSGVKFHDFDLCTNSLPDTTEELFKRAGYDTFSTGKKHGTVSVVSDKEIIEITTYRLDGTYSDVRRPDSVSFSSSLEEDLKRRDFTVNAMAYNENRGLVDIFNGREDLKNKIIRTVGNPDVRFSEDALRILRALRFSSVFGFSIEENTKKAIFDNYKLLTGISAERIRSEFDKLLLGPDASSVISGYIPVFGLFMPELYSTVGVEQNCKYHFTDVFTHTIFALEYTQPDLVLRLSVLFHDLGKPMTRVTDKDGFDHFKGHNEISAIMAKSILSRLKYPTETIKEVVKLVYFHSVNVFPTEKDVKAYIVKVGGVDSFRTLLALKRADAKAHMEPYASERVKICDDAEKILLHIIQNKECLSLADMKIDGNDLKFLGLQQGRDIGRVLNSLFCEVLDGRTPNDREKLLERAKIHIKGIKN